jgi:hypothetical protein
MIPMENARQMLQGMPGRPAPRTPGFGIRPPASPIGAASQPMGLGGEELQGVQAMPNQPANINATPSLPGMLSQEVPGKQAPAMPALNPSVAAPAAPPSAPATPATSLPRLRSPHRLHPSRTRMSARLHRVPTSETRASPRSSGRSGRNGQERV